MKQQPVEVVVAVVTEEIVAGTRSVERERVRVSTHTDVCDVDLDAVHAREEVEIERFPIGRPIEAAPEIRVEGDTTVIPVVEEVVVIEKRLVLREEIRITKRRVDELERMRVTLRRERAEVSRTPASDTTASEKEERS